MSQPSAADPLIEYQHVRQSVYRRMALMSVATLFFAGAIFYFFNAFVSPEVTTAAYSSVGALGVQALPYLFSSVVAAITVLAMGLAIPTVRLNDGSERIVGRLRDLSSGNLAGKVKLHGSVPLKDVAFELNNATATLAHQIDTWKVINRQQWGVLCQLRLAAEAGDSTDVLARVQEMESNWDKIAEIEESLMT